MKGFIPKGILRLSVRTLLLLLVLVSLLPILGVLFYSGMRMYDHAIKEAREHSLSMMQTISHHQHLVEESSRQLLATLARMPQMQRLDADACSAIFRELLPQNPVYANLLLADLRGRVVASALPSALTNVADRKYFRDVIRTRELSTGEYVVGMIVRRPVFHYAYPVLGRSGELKAVIVAALDLAKYDEILDEIRLPDDTVLAFTDHRGIRIYRHPENDAYAGKLDLENIKDHMSGESAEGIFTEVGVDGIRRFYAYTRFQLRNSDAPYLYMRLGIPEERALATVREEIGRSVLLWVFIFLIAFASAWLLGSVLIRNPIRRMILTMNRFRGGEENVRTLLPHTESEMGQLSEAFDELYSDLEQRNREQKQAEEEIRKAHRWLSDIIDFLPDATLVLDRDGRVIAWNRAIETMTGIQAQEMLGKGDCEYALPFYGERRPILIDLALHPDPERERQYTTLCRTGDTVFGESYVTHLPSGHAHLSATATVLRDANGDVVAAIECIRDNTQRRLAEVALQESEDKYRQLFESAHDAILLMDEGCFVDCNQETVEMYGCEKKLFIGKAPWQFSPDYQPDGRSSMEAAREKIAMALAGVPLFFEWRHCRYDGVPFDAEVSLNRVEREGKFFLQAIVRDVTDRKRAGEALKSSEEQFRAIFEVASIGMAQADLQTGRWLRVNEKMCGITGYTPEEMLTMRVPEITHPEDRERDWSMFQQVVRGERKDYRLEKRYMRKNGQIVWVNVNMTIVRDANGQPVRTIATIEDITERKRVEEEHRALQRRLSEIIDFLPDPTLAIDSDKRIIVWNRAMEEMTGISAPEMIGKGDYAYTVPFYGEPRPQLMDLFWIPDHEVNAKYPSLHREDNTLVIETFCPALYGGRGAHVWAKAAPLFGADGRLTGAIEVIRDVTGRKRAEAEIRDTHRRLSDIIDFLPDATLILDRDGRVIAWNRAIEAMTGIGAQEMIGKGDREYALPFYGERRPILIDLALHPDPEMEKRYTTIRRSGDIVFGESFVTNLPSGVAHLSATASVLRDANGDVVAAIECIRDNTERKRAEVALQESEERLRVLFESIDDFVFIKDPNRRYVLINEFFAKHFGMERRELLGKTDAEISLFENKTMTLSAVRGSDARVLAGESVEYEMTHMIQGVPLTFSVHKSPIRDDRGAVIGICGISRDITERRREEEERRQLQERLSRSEKMESLGMLAGGVAHDLNNVLGILVGYSELLLEELDPSSPLRSHAEYILQGGGRAAAIVQDLLTLARRGVQAREVVDLNAIIDDVQDTPEFEKICHFHPDVRVETVCSAGLLNIKGSPVHLRKTIMNLVSNAAEAMPVGGRITIRTSNEYLDRPIAGYDDVREGEYVVLSVADTGEGIPASDIKRIFEPFYTKKVMGRSGTGLGLAVVWGTVKDHSGYINVQSETGKGTTFTLYFPVTRERATPVPETLPKTAYRGDGESILIVDDVAGQRELAAEMLTRLQYSVTTVASGEEAVEYLRANRADLVVLDMIMDPGIDGLETYRRIKEIHPLQKAIIVSGYAESGRVHQAQKLGVGAYVRKPYVMEALGVAVKKELKK